MEVGKRVVLKVSGEALKGTLSFNRDLLSEFDNPDSLTKENFSLMIDKVLSSLILPSNIDESMVEVVCNTAKEIHNSDREVIIVPGAGNLWRGRQKNSDMDAIKADQIGMLGINMNAIAIGEKLDRLGIANNVLSSVPVEEFGILYNDVKTGRKSLGNGEVLIIGGGTGSPLCTSDSATVKAAAEYDADTILFGKSIDGVYDKDPGKDETARKYKYLTYLQLMKDQLERGADSFGVMDFEAMARLVKDPRDMIVYKANDEESIGKILNGEDVGTVITQKVKRPEFYRSNR